MLKKETLWLLLWLALPALRAQTDPGKTEGLNSINRQSMMAHLGFLSSDLLEGREAGKRGAHLASLYLAAQFQALGLTPFSGESNGSPEDFLKQVYLVRYETVNSTLSVHKRDVTTHFEPGVDFKPQATSASTSMQGTLIFGGYGLGNGPFHSFSKNTEGKILLRVSGYPGANDSTSQGYKLYHQKSERELNNEKNKAAREAGIIAILEFDPAQPDPFGITKEMPDVYAEKEMTKYSSGIYKRTVKLAGEPFLNETPIFTISQRLISFLEPHWQSLLTEWEKPELKKRTRDKDEKVISLSTEIKSEPFICHNVIGCIPGKNKEEMAVIGAHFDHLGFYDGYIYNGADDNASGAVGVLELARAFALSGIKPEQTLVFAAWTAEERGLHGSTQFVKNLEAPSKISFYHNYDMIGRSANPQQPDSNVALIYTKAWNEVKTISQKNNEAYNLSLNINYAAVENPTGGSDNAPFAKAGIPIVWFHTGGHADYHRPSDHIDKIDQDKWEAIVKLSFLNLWEFVTK